MKKLFIAAALLVAATGAGWAQAGFLEMPDTSEVPDYERESLLLDLDIPGVRDRDPNPEAGPRLNIREFRVQGLVEYPQLGISRAEIIKRVEKIRFEMMNEEQYLESGYTPDEIAEVSDLVAQIEKETEGRHVTPTEVQRLVFLIREQRRKRGVTVGMIETVADTISRYYRERGFFLAKAYIPKQHVRDGVVTITLLLGELGEVNVQNNKRYSSRQIERVFDPLLATPVSNARIEEGLFLVNDLPGLSATGYFEPGTQIGDTRLNVNVNQEKWYAANLRVDNHGSESTGEYRTYADFYWNNVTGIGDQLQLGVLGSFSPDNSLYGSLRYSLPIYTPRWEASFGVSSNDFVTATGSGGASNFEVTGESEVMDAGVRYKITRTRTNNRNLGLTYSKIRSETNFGNIRNGGIEKIVDKMDIYYDFDRLNETSRSLQQGKISLSVTKFVEGVEEGQEDSPMLINIDYSRLAFVNLPFFDSRTRWIARVSGQYSGEALSEVLQFGLAGPSRARGYKINEFYADDGAYIGNDLIFSGPSLGDASLWGERISTVFQPFVFLDAGYGKNNAFIDGEPAIEAYLISAGAGFKLNFKNSLRGEIAISEPLDGKNSYYEELYEQGEESTGGPAKPGEGTKIYFNLQYGF